MMLHKLSAEIAKFFSDNAEVDDQSVVKVKDENLRDVVTEKDLGLHALTQNFLARNYPEIELLSEEGVNLEEKLASVTHGEVVVIDPLDGTNNFALGLPGYGYMACRLLNGVPVESLILVPEQNTYLLWSKDGIVTSRSVDLGSVSPSSPIYYGYPPKLSDPERALRSSVMNLIDENSSGFYRYGSACIGLFNLILGKHSAFIGQRIRIWDGLAFLPVLESMGLNPRYSISSDSLNLVVGYNEAFIDEVAELFAARCEINLISYRSNETLEFM
jgi:myo-inositol-1(or 4)-monophosphatase